MISHTPPVVMVCTVGGTPDPLRTSICFHRPSHVIYMASPQSRNTIRTGIEDKLEWHIRDTQTITLANYQDIVQCVQDMRKGIVDSLHAMSLPEDTPLIADITGGTKIMSAALALVMMEFKSRFSYVGGEVRTKDGLGIVQSGTESVVQDANPWDVLALREVRALAHSFNHAQFADALATAKALTDHMENPDKQKFYGAIVDLVHGYMLWDGFDHKAALAKLKQANSRLSPYAYGFKRLAQMLDALKQDIGRLETLQQEVQALRNKSSGLADDIGKTYLLDLLGNARRRAEAGHYDDAVARLYSAMEKCAKTALWTRHNIDNGNVRLKDLPESLQEEWRALADKDGVARVGLEKSFLLLNALNDPLGKLFLDRQKTLKDTLQARNESLLAHGYTPIGEDKYQKLLTVALNFLEVESDALPVFPHMDWKALLP